MGNQEHIIQKMKKNILFLNCDSLWFGSEKILFYIIKILKKNYNCFIALPYKGLFEERLKELGTVPFIVAYPVLRKKYFSVWGLPKFIFEFIKSLFFLNKIIKEKKIDIIYSNSVSVTEGIFLSLINRKMHIWHIHSVIERPKILYYLLKFLLRFSDLNIFVSNALLTKYKLKTLEKNKVIHNGAERIIINKTHNKKFTIGIIGTFNEQKGHIYLLRAVKYLLDKHKIKNKIKLILTGPVYETETKWLEEVKKFITDNGLINITEINGFVPDIEKIYRDLDIFVLTSVIFDPFPTVALESISCKIPVIAFKCGGVEEILGRYDNCLTSIKDYKSLAELIYKYYNDKDERIALAEKQHEFYNKNFTFEIFKKNLKAAVIEISEL